MYRSLVLLLFMLFAGVVKAQPTVPDNELILREIINADSEFYYPKLFSRYTAGDTTLTDKDYFYLYYGYANQESYKPLEAIPAADRILEIINRNASPDKLDAQMIIELGKEVMQSDPFSPTNINFMTYAYNILGDTINEIISADRLKKVLRTIQSSGTGLKEASPWHILWFSHASDLLASKQLEILKRQVVTRSVEYIPLKVKDGDVKGYFFDFGRVYWRRPENPTRTKRVQGIEINGIKVGNKSKR